jgi:hypothetical protein
LVVCKLSSKLVVRLTIHGDKDRRLEVGPWSLDLVAYPSVHPKARASDVLVVDDLQVRICSCMNGASWSKYFSTSAMFSLN